MIQLVAFLGNPGKEYSHNRHNAGFLLAEKPKINSELKWQKKFKGFYAVFGGRVHFIKPLTFMNLSGESVSQAVSFFKIKPDAIIVVHDELELPLGVVSLKFSGGLGGHNGLRSMKRRLAARISGASESVSEGPFLIARPLSTGCFQTSTPLKRKFWTRFWKPPPSCS